MLALIRHKLCADTDSQLAINRFRTNRKAEVSQPRATHTRRTRQSLVTLTLAISHSLYSSVLLSTHTATFVESPTYKRTSYPSVS